MLRPVVTFWNVAPYIAQCIESIRMQKLRDWHCHVFDDCSTDGSLEIAMAAAEGDPRFTFVRNTQKMWQLGNWWQFSRLPGISGNDVLVSVDGDDWLPDDAVFTRVAAAYEDRRIWLTYGNFKRLLPGGAYVPGFCRQVPEAARIRELQWTSSSLRTFKLFLFRKIQRADLESPGGGFFQQTGDMAVMFPMIEMAGDKRSLCLPGINYVYNTANPNCTFSLHRESEFAIEQYLRAQPPYALLPDRTVLHSLGEYAAGILACTFSQVAT